MRTPAWVPRVSSSPETYLPPECSPPPPSVRAPRPTWGLGLQGQSLPSLHLMAALCLQQPHGHCEGGLGVHTWGPLRWCLLFSGSGNGRLTRTHPRCMVPSPQGNTGLLWGVREGGCGYHRGWLESTTDHPEGRKENTGAEEGFEMGSFGSFPVLKTIS